MCGIDSSLSGLAQDSTCGADEACADPCGIRKSAVVPALLLLAIAYEHSGVTFAFA